MGARGEYGKSKRNGGAVLEGNGRAAKGEEENDTKEGVRGRCVFWMIKRHRGGMFVFRSGCFVSSRGFSKMIGEGCDVGGLLWSC